MSKSDNTVCFNEPPRLKRGRVPPKHIDELLSHLDDYRPVNILSDNKVYPLGFDSWLNFKNTIKRIANKVLKYDKDALIGMYGSSIQGYKYVMKDPKELWFNEESDYDIIICSEKLYNYIKYEHPRLLKKKTFRTHPIPHNLNDKMIKNLYKHSNLFPHKPNITFYKHLREVLSHCILYLHIECDDDGNVIETSLIGKDIINNTVLGDRKELLNRYHDRFSNTLPIC